MSFRRDFAARLRARAPLVGTFVKSRDPAVIELLGLAGFDYAVLDAEHAAFGRSGIADMAMASRAARLPLVVRVPTAAPPWIATALDAGAAGVMVPQVADAAMAEAVARATRHGIGGLGFSPSVAGAEYGSRGIAGHLARHPEETVLICQIEDPNAVAAAQDIAAVADVDALLIGPVDLAVAAGETDPTAPAVKQMIEDTSRAAETAGKAAGLFLSQPGEAAGWAEQGVSLFLTGTDQGFLTQGAKQALAACRSGLD